MILVTKTSDQTRQRGVCMYYVYLYIYVYACMEPVSGDQILRRDQRGQGKISIFPVQLITTNRIWQPYPVHPYSSYMYDHTYIHRYCTIRRKVGKTLSDT